jgi:hypothetical protein
VSTVVVQHNQNLVDIAIMHLGADYAFFDLAILNKLSPTAEITPGMVLKLPPVVNQNLVDYLESEGAVVATNDSVKVLEPGEGLEFWAIEYDFVINKYD